VSDRWGKIYVVDRTGSIVQTLQPPSGPEQLFGIEIADDGTTYVVGSDQRVHVFTSAGVYDRAIVVPTWCLFVALSTDQTKLFVNAGTFGGGVHYFDLANGDAYLGTYGATQLNSTLVNQVAVAADGTLYTTDDGFGDGSGTVEKYNADGSFGGIVYTGIRAGWGLEVNPFDGTLWIGDTNTFVTGVGKIFGLNLNGTIFAQFGPYPELGQNTGMAFYDPPANTPTGSGIAVTPSVTLPNGTTGTVTLAFDNVQAPGDTTVTTSSAGHPPASGFKLINPPVYYEITTTATFMGNVRVCLNWADGQIANESRVQMFHYDGNQWVDITDPTSRDAVNNRVCGTTSSFSAFALMETKYGFTGFFQPVDNLPTTNAVKAGAAVPVKFSLGGDRGLNVVVSGYAQLVQCTTGSRIDPVEQTVTAGSSSLSYDATTAQYSYVWKTDKAWANSCREFQLKLDDGEVYTARFAFSK
jgi:hypothetical protein